MKDAGLIEQPLIAQWRERAARAAEWQAGEDPEGVLEALALSVALELTSDLARVPAAARDSLRRVGQRALLHVGAAPGADEDELEARRMAAAIARDGLRALAGRARPGEPEIDARKTVPSADLARLLAGRLDGFAAGSLAMRVRRSPHALSERKALVRASEPEERTLALAAAEASPVRDPAGGRTVGTLEPVGAEAVLFEGPEPRLAVYAEDPAPLRLVGPGLTTEDVREGYWIGRIHAGVRRIEATLHVGDRVEPWVIDLS